jgi:signal transduction histidine kinase
VRLEPQGDGSCVTVADSGPGIPAPERDKVFRRFYRLEASRCLPGNGLGLSLLAAVAKLHDSELRVEDNAPGLRISMALQNPHHTPMRPNGPIGAGVSRPCLGLRWFLRLAIPIMPNSIIFNIVRDSLH